jgi:hypothetical protein
VSVSVILSAALIAISFPFVVLSKLKTSAKFWSPVFVPLVLASLVELVVSNEILALFVVMSAACCVVIPTFKVFAATAALLATKFGKFVSVG